MTTHVGLMVLFSLFVSTVFGVLMRDEPREQVGLGTKMLAALVGGGLVVGWLLYPLPF